METDKYIEVVEGYFFKLTQTGEVQIKIRGDNGKPYIAMLYNLLFAPDLCDWLFSIIMLIDSRDTYLYQKGFARFLLVLTKITW